MEFEFVDLRISPSDHVRMENFVTWNKRFLNFMIAIVLTFSRIVIWVKTLNWFIILFINNTQKRFILIFSKASNAYLPFLFFPWQKVITLVSESKMANLNLFKPLRRWTWVGITQHDFNLYGMCVFKHLLVTSGKTY